MIFEKATRAKLRFRTEKGNLSVEDMWDLNLQQLNRIAKRLNKEIKESSEEDFLEEKSAVDVEAKLQFDIVLYILETKKAETKARKEASTKKAEKEKLLSLLAEKQDEAMKGLTEEHYFSDSFEYAKDK